MRDNEIKRVQETERERERGPKLQNLCVYLGYMPTKVPSTTYSTFAGTL